MIKTFPIDFVRAVLNKRLNEYANDPRYFNDNDISLVSFYEHLASDDEVDRFVDTYQQLVEQQNRQHMLGVGIVSLDDTPTLTNVKDIFTSAMSWGCSIRCTLENRDKMAQTIFDLCGYIKGRKFDIAQLDNGQLLVVGTAGSELFGNTPSVKNGDFLGEITIEEDNFDLSVKNKIDELCGTSGLGFSFNVQSGDMLYGSVDGNLVEINAGYDEEEETLTYSKGNDYGTFEKFKLTLSCNGAKVDQPYTLEKDEYCEITFSGDATISNDYILHDSDICRIGIKRYRVVANNNIAYTDNYSWLDPLEKNGELGSNQIESQLRSHFFMANSNTDSISINREYEFMYDYREPLLNALYEYAQYGIRGTSPLNVIISPNMEFKVCEIVSSWGYIKKREFTAKLIDSISAPNNEDGIVSIKLTLGIQGE